MFSIIYVYDVLSLIFIPPMATIVSYANNFDPDETPSNSASYPDTSCLTLGKYIHQL